ncbi:MAG: endonuclease/exonuclease/phosphatase family protein [Bacteroidales bacterium]|nr:endonuclease/exonuclease/phosphatase family protein [Bacteroidales bacterium]MBN2762598.1 endonuclease/exonuclease/phosphatase family protein [Bacteroidales bacterium]
MRNLFRNILLIINLALAFVLILSYLSVYISPEKAWIFAFIGLAYSYILLINILFVIFWIIFRKWYFLISLLIILAGWDSLKKLIRVNPKSHQVEVDENSFRIMSNNVRLFNYYQWEKDTAVRRHMMAYINAEVPSVVCFQEFLTLPGGNISLEAIKRELKNMPFTHVHYTHRIPGKTNFGLATFSKYPIINKGFIEYKNSLNGVIFSDMVIAKDTVRIYNCHLQSVKLKPDYNKVLDSLIFYYDQRHFNEMKSITVKLRDAYIKRAGQSEVLSFHIQSSPHPVIVCGDFNDTPFSYSYYRISRNLRDAFVTSGSGIGSTYRQNIAPIRIDYILYDPSLCSSHFVNKKTHWSDHYPVMCDFTFVQKAD